MVAQDCPWRMWSKMGWSLRRSEGKRWWMNHENAMEIYWNICGHGKTSIIPSYHILCIFILQYPPIISGWMIRTYNDQASIRYLRNLANHPNILPRSEWGYIRALEPPCYIWMWSGQSMMIHSFEMGEFQANIKLLRWFPHIPPTKHEPSDIQCGHIFADAEACGSDERTVGYHGNPWDIAPAPILNTFQVNAPTRSKRNQTDKHRPRENKH